jgi:cytochrome P450
MISQASADREPPEATAGLDVGAPDSLQRMTELFARHGDVYRMHVPARRTYTYVIHHPDDIKRVLVTNHRNYTKGVDADRIRVLLDLGLMTSEGPLWERHHRMMQPLFHRRILALFAEAIDGANERFCATVERRISRDDLINITEAMSELTLEIVLAAIFGTDLAQAAERFAVLTNDQARNLEFVYKFRSLRGFIAKLIRRRRERCESHRDYLGMLLEARDDAGGQPLSDREVIDEVMTFVVAGHETTASVLNWTWYLLSEHPRVDERLAAELAPMAGAAPWLPALEEMPYARQVLNETMRLYPPGWLLSRRAIAPDVLGGFEVPSGSSVLLPLYLLHRHPRYWQEPDVFDPDRFAPEREVEDHPRYAFIPFSAGPRHCIGETFAIYEMLMHLRKVVPRYRLERVPDCPLELEAQINLRSRYPLQMRIVRR